MFQGKNEPGRPQAIENRRTEMERSATLRGQTLDDGPRSHSHNATPPRIFASLDEPRERASIARSVFAGIPEKNESPALRANVGSRFVRFE